MDATAFLRDLHHEVANHAGIGHSLLGRMELDPKRRDDFKIFSSQHYPLVGTFTLGLGTFCVIVSSLVG